MAWAAKRGHAAELPVRRQLKSCWDALLLKAGALGWGIREKGTKDMSKRCPVRLSRVTVAIQSAGIGHK